MNILILHLSQVVGERLALADQLIIKYGRLEGKKKHNLFVFQILGIKTTS